jgi:tetratricopeptide (TPR) repeat protein
MDFFVHDDELVPLRESLPPEPQASCLPTRVALAWYSRQRDTRQALVWVEQSRALLVQSADRHYSRELKCQFLARCQLIEAEIQWLNAENLGASALATAALALCTEVADWTGCADCHWLFSRIANDGGDHAASLHHLQTMRDYAQRIGDEHRQWYADIGLASIQAFFDAKTGMDRWKPIFAAILPKANKPLRAMIYGYFGVCAGLQSDFGTAVTYLVQACDLSRKTGQIRDTIRNAVNVGDVFSSLNDYQTALEWMQRGLDMARSLAWPVTLGLSLAQTADVLRHVGRFEAARQLLDESRQVLAPIGVSRYYAITVSYLGDLSLSLNNYTAAMEYFGLLVQHADSLQQPDFKITAWRGQAHALLQLGQVPQALRTKSAFFR